MPEARRKVLHVLGSLDRGGAETWLMHVLRHINHDQFQIDFLVHTAETGAYESEAKALGAQVLRCLNPSNLPGYAQQFRQILRENGPYHVVHTHVHQYGGWPLTIARLSGVPVRVAHSHLDTEAVDAHASLPRRLYLSGMKTLVKSSTTHGLAASRQAAPSMFGKHWQSDRRNRIFYCAIDLSPFENIRKQREAVRAELGIAPNAFVMGHVGRFFEQKNHAYLIDIAHSLKSHVPQARFLLVGEGPLREQIEQQATARGVREMFVFAGLRSDVQRVMGAMDVFVLPSLFEGLPLVGIEAQAAGLPCVIADTVTPEIQIVPEQVTFLPIGAAAVETWCAQLRAWAKQPPRLTQAESLLRVKGSPFNITNSIKALEEVYGGTASR
jgi:glycosyltransferase involved in cell wall biosynthesis